VFDVFQFQFVKFPLPFLEQKIPTQTMSTLDVKLHLSDSDVRRIHVPHAHLRDASAFRAFLALSVAPIDVNASQLQYRDAHGDLISLVTDGDLSNLLAVTPPSAPPTHVFAVTRSAAGTGAGAGGGGELLNLLLRRPEMLLEIPALLKRLVALNDPQQRVLDQAASRKEKSELDVDTDLSQLLAALGLGDADAAAASGQAVALSGPPDRSDLLQRLMSHPRVQAVTPQLLAALTDSGLAPGAAESGGAAQNARHSAICDICDEPIVGVRYQCTVCRPSFDLCMSCERSSEELHDPTHAFMKLKAVHASGAVSPPSHRFSPYQMPLDDGDSTPGSFGAFAGLRGAGRFGRWRTPSHQADVMLQAGGEFAHRAVSPLATVSPARGGSPRSADDDASAPPTAAQSVALIEHVSVPMGDEVDPGAQVIKMWSVRNSGASAWQPPVRLSVVSSSGLQLVGNNAVAIDAAVEPGADIIVAADVVAPTDAGVYGLKCALVSPAGERFSGDVLEMSVVVINAAEPQTQLHAQFHHALEPEGWVDGDEDVDDGTGGGARSIDMM
jgi:hypothetical protein